jgi:two-component system, cell cycle sensor histidine kinase PleC
LSILSEQKGVLLEFDTESEEIITGVDVDKIERIILNLLSNALKFTASGGKVSVSLNTISNKVFISVKDTGLGIPTDMQKSIFERFKQIGSTLTKEFEGSGIGLSLVKSFVELHNGTINVMSEVNKGSEFIIELPITLASTDSENQVVEPKIHNKIIEAINIEFSDIYSIAS